MEVDAETRCAHWHSAVDIVAIRLRCCDRFFACKECHAALADHPLVRWPVTEHDAPAVLCGRCRAVLSVREYLEGGAACPRCGAGFNPRCALHHPDYFELPPATA